MKTVGSQTAGQKIYAFVFRHWEKVVCGLAVLSIGAFFWFGRVKPYDKTDPSKLLEHVQQAQRYIQDPNSWTTIADFRKADDQAVEKILKEEENKLEPYPLPKLLGTKLATRGLRTDPAILKINEPRAHSVVGSLFIRRPVDRATGQRTVVYWDVLKALKNRPKAGANTGGDQAGDDSLEDLPGLGRGVRRAAPKSASEDPVEVLILPDIMQSEYQGVSPTKLGLNSDVHSTMVVSVVAVTALFPHEEQLGEYAIFKNSVKYNELRDQPYYVYLQIERRKQVDGKETEWEDITERATQIVPREIYATTMPEIVEEQFVDPYLTQPIPPLIGLSFMDFCSTPQTPVIVPPDDIPRVLIAKGARPLGIKEFDEKSDEPDKEEPAVVTATVPKYKLIRFFDVDVNPGELVQYRMRAWLADPNNPKRDIYARVWNKNKGGGDAAESADAPADEGLGGVRGRGGGGSRGSEESGPVGAYDIVQADLDADVRKRIKEQEAQSGFAAGREFLKYCRATEWSDPTNWTSVSSAMGRVIAGRVETGLAQTVDGITFYEAEPQVNVVVKKWDPALQVEVPVGKKVYRGAVMNFRSPAKVVNPVDRQVFSLNRELIEEGQVDNGVNFATKSFVVDVLGGLKMPFSTLDKVYFEPAEILVMGSNGSLQVRNELDDRMEYRHGTFAEDEALTDLVAETKPTKDEKKEEEEGQGPGRGRRR
jgi:hypothetical protein